MRVKSRTGEVLYTLDVNPTRGADIMLPPGDVGAIEIDPDQQADPYLIDNLDAIIGIAAAAAAWRVSTHETRANQSEKDRVKSFKRYLEYGNVLDTVPRDLQAWLMQRVPETLTRLVQGG